MNYRIQYNVGRVKYAVSYWDGEKAHKDGSAFYDLACFSNKRNMAAFVSDLESRGYQER